MNTITLKNHFLSLALLSVWGLCCTPAYGGSKTSAAAFLKVPASAQAMGLGGGAVVSGSGLGGALENPALLGFMRQGEFQTSYGSHLEGYNVVNAGYGHCGKLFNGAVSLTRVAASSFDGRDAQGVPSGGFSASDLAVNLSAGKSFEQFTGGVTVKYIRSAIESESATGFAADVGAVFLGDKYAAYPYKVGVSLRNLGTSMKYMSKSEALPLTASAGLAVAVGGGLEAGFNLSENITESRFLFGVGLGLNVGGGVAINGALSREMGAAAGGASDMPFMVNGGLAFKVSDFVLNYGFVPLGEMGNMQRMSLTFKFKSSVAEKKSNGNSRKKNKSSVNW
jgi:hypothetical protein